MQQNKITEQDKSAQKIETEKASTSQKSKESKKQKQKINSLKLSIFLGLFGWLFIGLIEKNIILSCAASLFLIALIYCFFALLPIKRKKAYTQAVEAELPIFLLKLATEIKTGKVFFKALADSCKDDGNATKEFRTVLCEIQHGSSLNEALSLMNERLRSLSIRRANSNIMNIYLHGNKAHHGLKKIAEELLLKQRIESKEFSGKMVVYALVFIAVSAIVPAMFLSFILIGSYFMTLSFDATQLLIISTILFPFIDGAVLMMINSKTPLFLRQ